MKLPYLKQQGLTIIELLAVIVIGSIIFTITATILTGSSSEHSKQVSDAEQLGEVTYVLKVITKDMRMSTKIEKSTEKYIFKTKDDSIIATYSFNEATKKITRDDVDIAQMIQLFSIDPQSPKVIITIKALNENEIKTELLFRSDG